MNAIKFLIDNKFAVTKNEAKRLLFSGVVFVNGNKLKVDENTVNSVEITTDSYVRVGKNVYPNNALEKPISELIEKLKSLPPGTTYREEEGEFYGGQCVINGKNLGTGYLMKISVVEGV